MSETIITVGVVNLVSPTTGERTGVIDICRDTAGNVHMRVNRKGAEVVIALKPDIALRVAELVQLAASGEGT